MKKKNAKKKKASKVINVEIAPGNQVRLDRYISDYNEREDRSTPVLKYTDVVNEALHLFMKKHVKNES